MANKNVLAICLMFLVASSVVYEAQGTFLLKMYLKRKIIRTASNFTPIACKGMLLLMNRLQGGCPATREFKEFFSLFTSYVNFISNASATSKDTDTEITSQVDGLANAMSELTAVKGRAPSNTDFRDTMLSMGKTLIEQKKKGSQPLTHQQRKVLVAAMVQWTKTIATLVKTAVDLRVGDSMDISNLGLDVDVNSIVGGESDTKSGSITYEDTTGGGSGSPSGSPTDSPSGSPTDSPNGSPTESSSGSPMDSPSGSPTESPNGSPTESSSGSPTESSSGSPTDSPSGTTTDSPSGSPTDSPSGSPTDSPSGTTTDSPSGSPTDSPSGSPTGTPSDSKSASGETSDKGSESGKEAASPDTNSQSSSKTSAKQVEIQTSKEAISFIKGLEKKYAGTVQLDTFFEKLKTSMSATTKISNTNEEKFLSKMKKAVSSVSEAASSVSSKLGKSEEAKNRIDSSQEKLMKTFKELEDLNSKIVSENKGKTVSSTQQAELKEALSKWEQVTNQFVETATSSSSSDKSQSKSQSSQSQQSQEGSTKKAETS